jgi:hypothetical protein
MNYKTLQDILQPIKENTNMKNLKGLNEFSVNESTEDIKINEEYVEIMDPVRMANAMGEIQQAWEQWKNGPMTEPNMIKPAQKELKGWLDRWFKQNIK